MNRLSVAAASLLIAVFSTSALAQVPTPSQTSPGQPKPARQIVATYFHGDVRCATCKKLEAYSRAAIEKAFAAELADGRLVFRTVNTDREENAHFVTDFSLVTRSLVLTDEAGGKVVRWTNLDKIWQLVRDEPAFSAYVVDGVRGYLDGRP
jgi:hypothetical protein